MNSSAGRRQPNGVHRGNRDTCRRLHVGDPVVGEGVGGGRGHDHPRQGVGGGDDRHEEHGHAKGRSKQGPSQLLGAGAQAPQGKDGIGRNGPEAQEASQVTRPIFRAQGSSSRWGSAPAGAGWAA